MWLRFEVREKRKAAMLNRQPLEIEGLSTDNDDNPIKIKVNDQIISLQVSYVIFCLHFEGSVFYHFVASVLLP